MEIGFLESVIERPDGAVDIYGWARAGSVEIALHEAANPENVLLVLSARPDRFRIDVPDVPAAGFQITIAPKLLRLLPRNVVLVPSAAGHPLGILPECEPMVRGGAESTDALHEALAGGRRWHRKSGGLLRTISQWPAERRAATLDLLEDVARASANALSPAQGTLLGIIRMGTLLPHDDDVDMAAYVRAESLEEFVKRWVAILETTTQVLGLDLFFHDDLFHPLIVRDDAGIDCWPVWVRSDGTFVDVHASGRLDDFTLMEAVLEGRPVRIPRSATQLLEHCYGPTYLAPDPAWRPDRAASDEQRFREAYDFRKAVNREMPRYLTIARRSTPI